MSKSKIIENSIWPDKAEFVFIIKNKEVTVVMYRYKYAMLIQSIEVCWHKWNPVSYRQFNIQGAIDIIDRHFDLI